MVKELQNHVISNTASWMSPLLVRSRKRSVDLLSPKCQKKNEEYHMTGLRNYYHLNVRLEDYKNKRVLKELI